MHVIPFWGKAQGSLQLFLYSKHSCGSNNVSEHDDQPYRYFFCIDGNSYNDGHYHNGTKGGQGSEEVFYEIKSFKELIKIAKCFSVFYVQQSFVNEFDNIFNIVPMYHFHRSVHIS